jgi:hypothetical protein
MNLEPSLNGRHQPPGTRLSFNLPLSGHPAFQRLAENPRKWSTWRHHTQHDIKLQRGWTPDDSKMNLEQCLSGCQLLPGTRWPLHLPLIGQRSNFQLRTNKSSTLGPTRPGKCSVLLNDSPMNTWNNVCVGANYLQAPGGLSSFPSVPSAPTFS